ncbi:Transposase DDE domain-containing protein [Bizionia paragorgiae]|uniref:Transposase DDE domain-containing protein n=2 Tax=Bizionia paragorgiae TaxID=283786 RepID=A0A1H4CKI2_BIZPA|nr:Transposase DDE domain-containing protein [Bizionia paragorgiae]
MKGKRQSTVEPVFGTLTQFMGLIKINTIKIKQANKVMHLAALAYNLKKYLKFTQKLSKTKAKALGLIFSKINGLQNLIIFSFHQPKFN